MAGPRSVPACLMLVKTIVLVSYAQAGIRQEAAIKRRPSAGRVDKPGMKLQQLRYLTEVVRRGLNVSEAAQALHTSQPGVSKQIRALEDELGIEVFARHGKRLVAVTEPGKAVVSIAERILAEAHNLRRAGEEFANDQVGTLTIAATHTQARYSLPKAVAAFKRRYPGVKLVIHQGNPTQICEQVLAGEADLCVATEAIAEYPELISMPVFQWNRCVVVPP